MHLSLERFGFARNDGGEAATMPPRQLPSSPAA
jgi:hypothetical protein